MPPRPAASYFIVSPDGMLGRAWKALLETRGIGYSGASFPDLDLRDSQSLERLITPGLDVVINCAAFTDVDGAETREAEADAVNATGVGNLAARCRAVSATLVHYSTDYVFDGRANQPYTVDEPRRPQNAYGRSKARGEELLERSGCSHLLIRTSWLYAPWGKNFVDTIARLAASQPSLRVVNDQRGRPASAEYLAERTLGLVEHGARGTFHVTDGGECTWFEFAKAIVTGSGLQTPVDPCTSAEFVRPAVRPAYSVFDLSRTEALLGPSRSWQDNLVDVLASRRRNAS